MKKYILTLSAAIFISAFSQAQNLVLNPGLESYITCPGFGQFSNTYIANWDKPTYGSTDYYHYNCPGIIPSQQVPHGGNAYAGIIGYNYGTEYREYMTGTLVSPLIPGATYYCEFYVSLNDGYIQAIKELGAHFSVAPPGPYSNALHVPLTPQVMNTTILLDDTSSWMKVSGYFLAAGGEQYITIGNFLNDTNTTIVQVGSIGSYGSYYFVDDVWVSLSEGTGIAGTSVSTIHLIPNPAHERIYLSGGTHRFSKIEIYNLEGKQVYSVLQDGFLTEKEIDIRIFPTGIYFVDIHSDEGIVHKKFLKN